MSGWLDNAAAPFAGADPAGALEAALLARLRDGFGWAGPRRALRNVDPIETPFDAETPGAIRVAPPALYLAPLTMRPTEFQGEITIRWAAYCVAAGGSSRSAAAGGQDPFGIGAYAIAMRAALLLQDWRPPVDGAGSLRVIGAENLTGLALAKEKFCVMALTFETGIACAAENPEAALAEFLIFHADIDLPPLADPAPTELPAASDAAIRVELPER